MTDLRDTRYFKIKKWILFAVCLSYTIILIIVLLMPGYFAECAYNEYDDTAIMYNIKQTNFKARHKNITNIESAGFSPEDIKKNLKRVIFIVAFSIICFGLMGLIGAYMQDHCLSTAFAAAMIFYTLINIVPLMITIKGFFLAIVNLAVTILAFSFAWDLKNIGQQLQAHPMVSMEMTQPVQQTVIPLYPTAVIGCQYPQQQQQQQYNNGMAVCGGSPLPEQPPSYSDIRDIDSSDRKYHYPIK